MGNTADRPRISGGLPSYMALVLTKGGQANHQQLTGITRCVMNRLAIC